jgi:hypothetical protein
VIIARVPGPTEEKTAIDGQGRQWQSMCCEEDSTLCLASCPNLHLAVVDVFDIYTPSDRHYEFRGEQRELTMTRRYTQHWEYEMSDLPGTHPSAVILSA